MQDSSLVCRLKKSLYGLKQARGHGMPRWTPTCCHRTLYVVSQTRMFTCSGWTDSLLLLVMYVDDLLISCPLGLKMALVK
jgi:hypothetical protein